MSLQRPSMQARWTVLVVGVPALFLLAMTSGCATGDQLGSPECTTSADCDGAPCVAGVCGALPDATEPGGLGSGGGAGGSSSSSDGPDVVPPDASGPEDGDFLAECREGVECESGICLSSPLGRVCTQYCTDDEDCEDAPGWTCQVINRGADLVEICYPQTDSLCEPCETDTECGGLNDRCITVLNGRFCGLNCRAGDQCPVGYECRELEEDVFQCAPVEDRCGPCRDADLSTSIEHCGTCDNACVTPNAQPICSGGVCGVFACEPGWGNCDGDDFSGCETGLVDNVEHCGSCFNACGDEPCIDGSCGCPGDQLWCGDACRTPNVCGGCEDVGNATPGDACGACGEGTWTCGDDGSLACLTEAGEQTGEAGAGCGLCDAGSLECDEDGVLTCVDEPDLETSNAHCGECGVRCTDGSTCVDGSCRCPDGEVFCDGRCRPDNGCGGCDPIPEPGTVCGDCQNGVRVCNGRNEVICQGATTNPCGGCNLLDATLGETCQSCGQYVCSGTQVICQGGANLQGDRNNCGACGFQCPSAQNCIGGDCRCPNDGERLCSGSCVNTEFDRNNCGSCGRQCATGESCVNGNCQCPNAGEINCSGNCVNPQTDRNNCGSCSNQCAAVQSCVNGNCQCPNANETVCGGQCVNTQSDNSNCGSCGSTCQAPRTCINGQCVCPNAGETFCGAQCINTQSDDNNCGGCGNRCSGDLICRSGECRCPSGLSRCGSRCYELFGTCGQCQNGSYFCVPFFNILECSDRTNACGGCENATTQCSTCNCGNSEIGCATWACSGGTELFCSPGCPSGYTCEGTRCNRN
ncbi:MAG: hypothetical protein EA398_03860 [Deltaproteobacteria bacterium]|nr:MAG: hypothetical protein EA398_03860 [Deltaproteobacteria bacterium]